MPQIKFLFKFLPIFLLCFCANNLSAQLFIETQYFDENGNKVSKDSAIYYADVTKVNSSYVFTKYLISNQQLITKAHFKDLLLTKKLGLEINYYKSGQLQDSSYYGLSQQYMTSFNYHENGQLWVEYHYDSLTTKSTTKAFDEKGIAIPDFIFFRYAEYVRGRDKWSQHLRKSLNLDNVLKKKPRSGVYRVFIKFIVDTDGKIIDYIPETAFGYGMEEEAIRMIKSGGKWNPEIRKGVAVKSFRIQPVTFVISEDM